MIATNIAPISDWSSTAAEIGVTWKGRGYSDATPLLSSYAEAAVHANPGASLRTILEHARLIQSQAAEAAESERYYARLPRRGDTWTPSSQAETVVWTALRSNGNRHLCDRDMIASVYVRTDGCVVPTLRNGLGEPTGHIAICDPGTPPAAAVRRLVQFARRNHAAQLSLARAAAQCERYA